VHSEGLRLTTVCTTNQGGERWGMLRRMSEFRC
jgi:hypothetical protein